MKVLVSALAAALILLPVAASAGVDAAGIEGIGEVDGSPEVAKAIIDAPFSNTITCGLRQLVIGENPLQSEADMHRTLRLLKSLELMVVQDIFLTATAEIADVVLPATAAWAETEGTVTNSERRVQRVRKALDPPGEARSDHDIFALVAARLGLADRFTDGLDEFGWLRRLWEDSRRRGGAIGAGLEALVCLGGGGTAKSAPATR